MLTHVALWLLGARGRRATTAVALALYSGGTLATVATLLLLSWLVVARRAMGPNLGAGLEAAPLAMQVSLSLTLVVVFLLTARFVSAFGKMMREAYGSPGRG